MGRTDIYRSICFIAAIQSHWLVTDLKIWRRGPDDCNANAHDVNHFRNNTFCLLSTDVSRIIDRSSFLSRASDHSFQFIPTTPSTTLDKQPSTFRLSVRARARVFVITNVYLICCQKFGTCINFANRYIALFLGAFAKLRKATISFVKSVRMELGSQWKHFQKRLYLRIFRKSVDRSSSSIKIWQTFAEDLSIFITTWSILLKMRSVSDKIRKEKQNTHFMFNKCLSENRTVYEIKSEYIVEPDMPQIIESNAGKKKE